MLPTNDRRLYNDDLTELSAILVNESLFHDLSKQVTADAIPLAIDTLAKIKKDPFICYQNLVANNPAEVDHEIFQFLKDHDKPQITEGPNKSIKLIIVESTREEDGRSDDFLDDLEKSSKYVKVARPYLPFSELIAQPSAKEAAIFTVDYVVQKLETNFFLDKINPAFVGDRKSVV